MSNLTIINSTLRASETVINSSESINESTVINAALFNLTQIPSGTLLCDKYRVISPLNIFSGEASLFICEYEGVTYTAKLYRRDVAIKDEVVSALKSIDSPYDRIFCCMSESKGTLKLGKS